MLHVFVRLSSDTQHFGVAGISDATSMGSRGELLIHMVDNGCSYSSALLEPTYMTAMSWHCMMLVSLTRLPAAMLHAV